MAIGIHIEDNGQKQEGPAKIRHRLTPQVAADAGWAGTLNGRLRDLSRTGFLIETTMPLAEGEAIAIAPPKAGDVTAASCGPAIPPMTAASNPRFREPR